MNQLKVHVKMITLMKTRKLLKTVNDLYYGWGITDKSEIAYVNTSIP